MHFRYSANMKRNKLILAVVVVSYALVFPACTLYDTYKKATTYTISESTADEIILRSEQLTRQALITFDTFLSLERNNEEFLKRVNPGIHAFAEKVREDGKSWILAMRTTTKAFKANRTSDNEANLKTAYQTLLSGYNQVKTLLHQAQTSSP